MFSFFVNSEGGLTTAGYVAAAAAVVLLFAAGVYLTKGSTKERKVSVKQLAVCGMLLALAYVASYIKIFEMPFGGTITLFSMLFIVLVGNLYGLRTGLLVGLTYGILQFMQEPYVLSFFQVCCDYFLAFAALGLSGLFWKSKNGLIKGYIVAILARGAFHTLGGYLYWMSYMPENFPKSLSAVYPIVYNYSYILAEGVVTVLILMIPAMKSAIDRVRNEAVL